MNIITEIATARDEFVKEFGHDPNLLKLPYDKYKELCDYFQVPYVVSFLNCNVTADTWGNTVGFFQFQQVQPKNVVLTNVDFKCECGSEAVRSPRHSTWCPKHKESV